VGVPLQDALESLRCQTSAARIIVVDNASEDLPGTVEGVEVVRTPARLTVGAARNFGLERVDTPYVVFWDADDLMLPGTLSHLEERIAAQPAAVAVAAAILEDEPRVPHRWPRPWSYPMTGARAPFAVAHCVWSLFPTTGSTIMRTAAVRDAGGYADANSGEDWVLGVSLAFRGRVVFDARPGRVYRRHPGSLWESRRSREHLLSHARAVRERIRRDPGIPRPIKLAVPVIGGLQILAIDGIRPAVNLARALPRRSSHT
jgi:glycosyltransferase involved in cell wall biosynthesis